MTILKKSPQEHLEFSLETLINHIHEFELPTNAKHLLCGDYNINIKKKNDQSESLIEDLKLFDLTFESLLNATRQTEHSESTIDIYFISF